MCEDREEDARLMERVCQRDQDAFEILYDRYDNLIYSVAARLVGREEAEEVLQEVSLKLWCKAAQFDPARGSLASWLVRMTRNRAIDALRRQRSRQPAVQVLDFRFDWLADEGPDLDAWAQREARAPSVKQALGALPPEQHEVVVLAYYEGLTQSQIASQLDIPLGTVKKRIRLGFQKLKRSLTQEGVIRV